MLVELTVEGRNFNTLADSGSQVNMIMPTLVQQYGFPVLPLEDLVDYPLNLMGLGGKCTSPLGFVILRIQVWGIAGYDEDAVFLVVPDEFDFRWRVPLVVGTCTIGRMINVIQERDRQPRHTVVHYEGGATAFLPVGHGRPCRGGDRHPS